MANDRRRLRIPDILWLEVPGAEFIYGEGERRVKRRLETFWISKYPVTNAQYQTFIAGGGYADEGWWRGLKRPEPTDSRWPASNCPRNNLDWYEVIAFCRWLTARLGLPEGGHPPAHRSS